MGLPEMNVDFLRSLCLEKEFSRTTVRMVENQLVSYMNLMVDATTGKILDLSKKIVFFENMKVLNIMIKWGRLDSQRKIQFELLDTEGCSQELKKVVDDSFVLFNSSSESNSLS